MATDDKKTVGEEDAFSSLARAIGDLAKPAPIPDDPELDATDKAHPAWWRGVDRATTVFMESVKPQLDILLDERKARAAFLDELRAALRLKVGLSEELILSEARYILLRLEECERSHSHKPVVEKPVPLHPLVPADADPAVKEADKTRMYAGKETFLAVALGVREAPMIGVSFDTHDGNICRLKVNKEFIHEHYSWMRVKILMYEKEVDRLLVLLPNGKVESVRPSQTYNYYAAQDRMEKVLVLSTDLHLTQVQVHALVPYLDHGAEVWLTAFLRKSAADDHNVRFQLYGMSSPDAGHAVNEELTGSSITRGIAVRKDLSASAWTKGFVRASYLGQTPTSYVFVLPTGSVLELAKTPARWAQIAGFADGRKLPPLASLGKYLGGWMASVGVDYKLDNEVSSLKEPLPPDPGTEAWMAVTALTGHERANELDRIEFMIPKRASAQSRFKCALSFVSYVGGVFVQVKVLGIFPKYEVPSALVLLPQGEVCRVPMAVLRRGPVTVRYDGARVSATPEVLDPEEALLVAPLLAAGTEIWLHAIMSDRNHGEVLYWFHVNDEALMPKSAKPGYFNSSALQKEADGSFKGLIRAQVVSADKDRVVVVLPEGRHGLLYRSSSPGMKLFAGVAAGRKFGALSSSALTWLSGMRIPVPPELAANTSTTVETEREPEDKIEPYPRGIHEWFLFHAVTFRSGWMVEIKFTRANGQVMSEDVPECCIREADPAKGQTNAVQVLLLGKQGKNAFVLLPSGLVVLVREADLVGKTVGLFLQEVTAKRSLMALPSQIGQVVAPLVRPMTEVWVKAGVRWTRMEDPKSRREYRLYDQSTGVAEIGFHAVGLFPLATPVDLASEERIGFIRALFLGYHKEQLLLFVPSGGVSAIPASMLAGIASGPKLYPSLPDLNACEWLNRSVRDLTQEAAARMIRDAMQIEFRARLGWPTEEYVDMASQLAKEVRNLWFYQSQKK